MRGLKHLRIHCVLLVLLFSGCKGSSNPAADLEVVTNKISKDFSDVPRISTSDLADWSKDSSRMAPQLLDVREPAEYAVSHLPGAIRISPDEEADQFMGRIDSSRPIVVYCSVGYRSSILAKRLIAAGAKQVMNLEGSIFKWANEGRPLVRDDVPTREVHPYNRKYGKLLLEGLGSEG